MTFINNKNYKNISKENTFDELFDQIENAINKDELNNSSSSNKHAKEYILRFVDNNTNIYKLKSILINAGYNVELIAIEDYN